MVTGNKTTERHWLIGSGNLAQSFWIAGALFVLPIAAMVYFVVTDLSAQIEFADKERLGAEYIVPLVHFQRAVIDYRTGIASPPAVDGASEATEADLAAVERAAQEVAAIDQRNGGTLRIADLWKIARRDWTRIKSGMQDATSEKHLAATDTLLVRLRKSIQDVADSSNLTLDPEIHTYYLMDTVSQKVPQALQFLGDGRDAGIASGDSAALADMVRFRSAMTSAAVASDQIRNSVKRAVESYVALDQTVGPAAKKAQDAIERVVRFAETGIPDLATVAAGPTSIRHTLRDPRCLRVARGDRSCGGGLGGDRRRECLGPTAPPRGAGHRFEGDALDARRIHGRVLPGCGRHVAHPEQESGPSGAGAKRGGRPDRRREPE